MDELGMDNVVYGHDVDRRDETRRLRGVLNSMCSTMFKFTMRRRNGGPCAPR